MKYSIHSICLIGMFAAVLAVLSILNIPTPWGVPFTLQTFAVALAGFALGKREGTISVGLYVLLGFVGVPVYTGMKAGPGVLLGPTGGYLVGFLFLAFFCGMGIDHKRNENVLCENVGRGRRMKGRTFTALLAFAGLVCCHGFGIVQLKLYSGMDWGAAALAGSVPYLLKDALSVFAAYGIALAIRRALAPANRVEDLKAAKSE